MVYSVPFAWVGCQVEVRGTAQHVVLLAAGTEVARHARRTPARLLVVPGHYDGVSTADVLAPTPLGRRATLQLAGLPGLLPPGATVSRPLDDYAQLLERLAGPVEMRS